MEKRINLSTYFAVDDFEIIKFASKLSGLQKSAFIRNAGLVEARRILRENGFTEEVTA